MNQKLFRDGAAAQLRQMSRFGRHYYWRARQDGLSVSQALRFAADVMLGVL